MLKEVNTKVIILLLLILKIKRHKKGNEKRKKFCISLVSKNPFHSQNHSSQTRIKTRRYKDNNKDDFERLRRYTLYSNKTCNKHVHTSCKNFSLPLTCRNSVICLTMRLCMATPNCVSFNKRATVIWGNFFTALLGIVCCCSSSSSSGKKCCCFVGVFASSFSSSATKDGGVVVFVFLDDVFFFVVFSVILF